jgi:excisionase family DNA binding protein
MNEIDTPAAVAEDLGISTRTLEDWRYKGTGPAYIHAGKSIRYRKADVEKWLNEQTIDPEER